MRNIKLTIEYDGTSYAGWQCQRNQKTVQGEIEKALRKILGEKTRLNASGRTDAGVHAKAQAANFKTSSKLAPQRLRKALNSILPEDIAIKECSEVLPGFNARFDAKSKVYRYAIYSGPSKIAINRQYICRLPYNLDIGLMKKEAKALIGRKNFKSFHASGRRIDNFTRNIKRIDIKKNRDKFIYIDIEANGFLYNMVRNIVGTLVDVGRGKRAQGSTKKILLSKNRRNAGPTMPAKGLCLIEVKY